MSSKGLLQNLNCKMSETNQVTFVWDFFFFFAQRHSDSRVGCFLPVLQHQAGFFKRKKIKWVFTCVTTNNYNFFLFLFSLWMSVASAVFAAKQHWGVYSLFLLSFLSLIKKKKPLEVSYIMKNNIRISTKRMQLCVISRQQFYSLHLLSLYKEAKKEKKKT